MKRIVLILFILIAASSIYLAYNLYQDKQAEQLLRTCIENILLKVENNHIAVETNNRGKSPVLTGTASKYIKNKLLNDIKKSCQITEIQDFITDPPIVMNNQTFINFSIDAFNLIITIKGAFNNQKEFDDVLKSFNNALPAMHIQHNVRVDSQVKPVDLALDITLLLASIENIHVADISIKDDKLILNGIIRDQITEQKTLNTLHQLFDDKYNIVNKLKQVADSKVDIKAIKIEPLPMPKLQLPQLDN